MCQISEADLNLDIVQLAYPASEMVHIQLLKHPQEVILAMD